MKKKIFLVLLLLISFFMVQVEAKKLPGFYAKTNVNVEKDVDASLFAVGQTVNVNSNVNGSSFIAGQDVEVKGSGDILFTAGQTIKVENVKTKDAFIAGETIKIKDSEIRDLFVAGAKVTIDSNISRNASIGCETLIINSTIDGDVYAAADNIEIGSNAVINGTLNYPKESKISISKSSIINKKKAYKSVSTQKDSSKTIITKIKEKVISLLSILLIGLIIMFIYNKLYKDIEKIKFDGENIFKNAFTGFLVLILVPIITILLLISSIGIPLSLISIALYIIFIYLSTITTSFYIGNKILKDKISNKYLLLTVSIVCLYVLKLIPVIGAFISFISLCLGLGLYFNIILSKLTIGKKY